MSILFDSHENPELLGNTRGRNQQDERHAGQSKNFVDKYEDILISGYQCKLFRDDQNADDINSGKFLIPWMGNDELLIDRYDCRGHLYRLDEFDFENMGEFAALSPDRMDVENVCDEERYMDLNKDTSEEIILQEEEDKRGSALYDPFTAYQNIEYAYEEKEGKTLSDCNATKLQQNATESLTLNKDGSFDDTYTHFCQYYGYDPTDENLKSYFQSQNSYQYDYADRPPPPSEPPPAPSTSSTASISALPAPELPTPTYAKFEPPEGIELPAGMELPETKKMQSIIEKTAMFISTQSAQMEIVLKTKQSGNPQFAFLNFDNYLNPYYKFILGKIKDGEYKEEDVKDSDMAKEDSSTEKENGDDDENQDEDDSSDGDENELHPLLQAHKRPLNQKVSSPPCSPKDEIEELKPIINPVAQTKLTGNVEDLAKVYMTWKYTANPGENQPNDIEIEETGEKEGTENINELSESENAVDELPPPPLPPPPSFKMLADINTESSEIQKPDVLLDSLQLPDFEDSNKPMEHPPQMLPGAPIFSTPPPMLPPPPSRPHLFPPLRFQPPQIGHPHFPPHMGLRPFHPPHGRFLNNHFQHMPHNLRYAHPPEMYQVRSSVPPPPPPPLPSLLPPGVDAPVSIINPMPSNLAVAMTYKGTSLFSTEGINSFPNDASLTHSHNSIINNITEIQFPSAQPLLPPGVENVISEKQEVPPPPPPPIIPRIDIFNMESSESVPMESEEIPNASPRNFGGQNMKCDQLEFDELPCTSFDEAITNTTSEDFISRNDTSGGSSPYKEECPPTNDSSEQSYISENHKLSCEIKKRKKKSRTVNSVDTYTDEHAFNINKYLDNNNQKDDFKQTSGHQNTSVPPDDSNISPFDQINMTLKNFKEQSTLSSTSRNALQNTQPPATSLPTKIIPPGKDLQLVIDRLALYVAKNGEEFEVGIKDKKDPRFDFLNPWNIYHPYYSNKKDSNLETVQQDKVKEEERKKNLKVKFGLKAKVKPVATAKKKATPVAASVFNQNEEDDENAVVPEGFQPNKDPELVVKRRLQKQIEEKERLLKQLHEQAILQQKIAEVNRQASIKPMLQNLTPQQQAILRKKVQAKQSQKDTVSSSKQDERKKKAANFVGMLNKKKSETAEEPNDMAGQFLRKRQFKETSCSKDNNSEPPDKANYEKKKAAFFNAINDAFKGT